MSVKQGLNDPPVLVAKNKQTSRVIWTPIRNSRILNLGEATVYTWKDKEGREWKGGLYKPSRLQSGAALSAGDSDTRIQRIRIQTVRCIPTAFAARALAATGNHGSADCDRSGRSRLSQ